MKLIDWFRFGRKSNYKAPDPEALVFELQMAALGSYSDMDRYREFRSVFLETEQGRRVLHQILIWGHVWTTSMSEHPHEIFFAEGERNLSLRVLAALRMEPVEKPQTQNVKRS